MDAFLEVTVAATSHALVSLDETRDYLGLDGTDDSELQRIIDRRSAAIVAFCNLSRDQNGRATLARETLVATFDPVGRDRRPELWLPWRLPVASVASVIEDGVPLTAGQYRIRAAPAMLERLQDGERKGWSRRQIVVTYEAGYLLPDGAAPPNLPTAITQAVLDEIAAEWHARQRDPNLRSVTVPDVYQATFAVDGIGGAAQSFTGGASPAGLLPSTVELLMSLGLRRVLV